MSGPTGGRRSFVPVVLLGLAGGALAAVAGSKPWAEIEGERAAVTAIATNPGESPLAAALALVVLACWGVLLVTRGVVRRAVAVLALIAALGTVATVVVGWSQTYDGLLDDVVLLQDSAEPGHTHWWFAALLGSLVSVLAAGLAVRLTPQWPEMGRRYDAPGTVPARPETAPEDQSNLELWRALDEGHDPTDRPAGGPGL